MKRKEKEKEQPNPQTGHLENGGPATPETKGRQEGEERTQAETGGEQASADGSTQAEQALRDWQDKYLRLSAEFDNFRKRTLREKMDLAKFGGEDVLVRLLPVIDDFERAIQAMEAAPDMEGLKEGIRLIYKKFSEFIQAQGVQAIEALHHDFDTDRHEALTKIPAPSDDLKGKIVDVVQKGYVLNEKVIRFAKVVIGE